MKFNDSMMKKVKRICPFTGGKCTECTLYRGRHHNLFFSDHFINVKDKKIENMPLRYGEVVKDNTKNTNNIAAGNKVKRVAN